MRIHGPRTVVIAALGVALASGCATDDPQAGGFLGGVVGLASGQYERDLREREHRFAGLQAEQWWLGIEERILAAEREALAAAIAVREQEADALAERALGLEAQIRRLRQEMARTQAERAELEAETARLDEALAGVRPDAEARSRELESLAEAAAALSEELAALERAAAEEAARQAELRAEIARLKEDLARSYPRVEAYGN